MKRKLAVVCSLLTVGVLLSGCGGGEEEQKPPTPAPVAQAPKPAAPVVPGGAPAAPGERNPTAGQPLAAATPLPEGADPADVFVVVPEDNAYVVEQVSKAPEDDTFTFAPLQDGVTGSTYVVSGSTRPPVGEQRPEFALPPTFKVVPEYGYDERGYPKRILCVVDKSQMALVSAGNFTQGTDDGPENAGPAHSVYLDEYYVDVAEVSLAQYTAFRSTLGDTEKRQARAPLNADGEPFDPVHGVRFSDAVAYAKWCGKSLPTEAEWEKAARGTQSEFPWGNGRAFFSHHRERTDIDRIMSFPQDVSPYGVWDMAGNVREWCADWYAPDAYRKAFDSGENFSNWTGPRNPGPDYLRVVKGNGPNWATWHREGLDGAKQIPGIGFRCVLRKPPAARTANR